MRNTGTSKTFGFMVSIFIKFLVAKPLCRDGLYERWNPETKKLLCCREVLVKQGFEVIPCTENEAEDTIRKCQIGKYQPDETNSSSSPQCIAEPQCTDEGIGKDLKCIDGYCWTVCFCSLEVRKCGLDPSNCIDIKDIKCMGKVLQDCSCASPVITTTLPTSPPTRSNFSTILKPINPDWTAKTLLPIPTNKPWTDTTKNTDKIGVTKDGTDTGVEGDEVYFYRRILLLIFIISSILVILVVSYLCVKFRKHCFYRPIGDHKESIEMLGSEPADGNSGLDTDKVSEATDSGVCGLSQGSNENHEPGEADPNSIKLSNGSDMESCRNMDNIVGDESDHEAGRGPSHSSCQIEVHKDSKQREELTIAGEEENCQESDQLLNSNECADDPIMRDLSQQSDEICESSETNANNNLINGLADPNVTHCKRTSTSFSGTILHHTDGNDADHGTNPNPVLSLCQLDMKKEPRQREKPTIVVEMEVEEVSLQEKKVAVVNPFMNEVRTIPVQDSAPAQNAENQPLRGEGYSSDSEGATAANLTMNWSPFGSSIYHDSTSQ